MDLIKHTTEWVQGEILQGKIMLVLGIIILIISIFIFKSEHEILKGMLIPIGLILLILFGAGGFQIIGRLAHISKVENVFAQNPKQAIQQEYEKAIKDNKAYSTLKPIWAGLIILSVILYFVFSSYYLKGLSIGLMGLFMTTLIVDSVLHYRLQNYFEHISNLMKF